MSAMKSVLNAACAGTRRDRANQYRMAFWVLAWSVAWVVATYGIRHDWFAGDGLVIAITAAVGVMGLGVVQSYRRYLREADELLRKIELDALVIGLATGLIGGVCYWMLKTAGVIAYKDAFIVTVLLICFSYSIASIIGHWRYA